MLEFILQYWIEFLFGLVVTAGSFIIKRVLKSYKRERVEEKKEFLKEIQKEIKSEFTGRDQKDIELQDVNFLDVPGRTFKASCKKLLEEAHEITLEEYEEITKDHDAYNSLGGNHNGDQLYRLVRQKVENSWTTNKE